MESGRPIWLLPEYRILATSPSFLAERRWLRSPIGFEIRFLYAHGSAQVGFSPFKGLSLTSLQLTLILKESFFLPAQCSK